MSALFISSTDAIRLRSRELDLAVLFRVALGEQTIRLWSGHGDFPLPEDAVEVDAGATYRGIGDLLDLPEVSQLVNGVAERAEFRLSGVGETAAALADEEGDDVEGAPVNLGIVVLDEHLQRATPAAWLWYGEADVVESTYDGAGDEPSHSIALHVATQQAGRRSGSLLYYSNTQQRLRSPDDGFCKRVSLFIVGYSLSWPQF